MTPRPAAAVPPQRQDGVADRLRNGALQNVLAARLIAEDLTEMDLADSGDRLVAILTDTARELRAIIGAEGQLGYSAQGGGSERDGKPFTP